MPLWTQLLSVERECWKKNSIEEEMQLTAFKSTQCTERKKVKRQRLVQNLLSPNIKEYIMDTCVIGKAFLHRNNIQLWHVKRFHGSTMRRVTMEAKYLLFSRNLAARKSYPDVSQNGDFLYTK